MEFCQILRSEVKLNQMSMNELAGLQSTLEGYHDRN